MPALFRSAFFPFFTAVVVIQGVHVVEHVIQLVQVYLFGIADDDALGLLGYVLEFQGTEEWLHLAFNSAYLVALYILLFQLRLLARQSVPSWAFVTFAGAAVALESWHLVEHLVIISNVIANNGCPCPGIGDVALGLSDTVLHFIYNVIAYVGTVIPFWYMLRTLPRRGWAVRAAPSR